jgi:hypothetical protein
MTGRMGCHHRRTLTGHTNWVWAVATAPDGTWLVGFQNVAHARDQR